MARFKIGEKVVLNDDGYGATRIGSVGVIQDDNVCPYVLFESGVVGCVNESELTPYTDPASEIAQIIEESITKSDGFSGIKGWVEPIPVDRFEFRFADEYGREVSHKFQQSEGDYNIIDVIASLRLFLLGVGYSQKDVDEIIREDRL